MIINNFFIYRNLPHRTSEHAVHLHRVFAQAAHYDCSALSEADVAQRFSGLRDADATEDVGRVEGLLLSLCNIKFWCFSRSSTWSDVHRTRRIPKGCECSNTPPPSVLAVRSRRWKTGRNRYWWTSTVDPSTGHHRDRLA
jgi:hypothetical protein